METVLQTFPSPVRECSKGDQEETRTYEESTRRGLPKNLSFTAGAMNFIACLCMFFYSIMWGSFGRGNIGTDDTDGHSILLVTSYVRKTSSSDVKLLGLYNYMQVLNKCLLSFNFEPRKYDIHGICLNFINDFYVCIFYH